MSKSGSGRIADRFASLQREGRGGLAAFIMAGDPDMESSARLLEGLPEAGASLVELGMPFSDPMADGAEIEEAARRALRGGVTLKKVLALAAGFREKAPATPLILMGYYNPIHHYGEEAFARDCSAAGVDGVIVVDMPPEEEAPLRAPLDEAGLSLIRLAAPNGERRMETVLAGAEGFLYYVGITGVTGGAAPDMDEVAARLRALRRRSNLPVALGFGVKTPPQAARAAALADMVVVGSAIVATLRQTLDGEGRAVAETVPKTLAFVRSLHEGIAKGDG